MRRVNFARLGAGIAACVFVVALLVAIVGSDVQGLVRRPGVYDHAIEEHGASRASGIDEAQLLAAGQDLREYLTDGGSLESITVVVNGQNKPLFNPDEQVHLRDVKARLVVVEVLQIASLVYIAGYIAMAAWILGRRALQHLARLLVISAVSGLTLLVVIGIAFLAGFDRAWDLFHEVLFSNGFWLLDPAQDHLIQMFPESFWAGVVAFLAGVLAIELAGLLALAALLRRLASGGHVSRTGKVPVVGMR